MIPSIVDTDWFWGVLAVLTLGALSGYFLWSVSCLFVADGSEEILVAGVILGLIIGTGRVFRRR